MKKVLIVATVVKTHIMHFHIPALKMLQEMGYETYVAAKNDYENPEDCQIPYCNHYYNIDFKRSPFHPKNIQAYKELKSLITRENFNLIHCHTPVGGVLTRLAARQARKNGTKVLYTAHGFHFYKGAPWLNWFLYFPVELICSKWTDTLITINQEDFQRAKRCMLSRKVVYIPGVGVDTDKFAPSNNKKNKSEIKKSLGIPHDAFVLLSVGELIKRKNHEIILKALANIKNKNIFYCIAGNGERRTHLESLSKTLGITSNVQLLGYVKNTPDLYNMCDAFIFPSVQEGLPVALMEAMSCGKPCIASRVRGIIDLLDEPQGGYLCKPHVVEEFQNAIDKLYTERNIPSCFKEYNRNKILNEFSMEVTAKLHQYE